MAWRQRRQSQWHQTSFQWIKDAMQSLLFNSMRWQLQNESSSVLRTSLRHSNLSLRDTLQACKKHLSYGHCRIHYAEAGHLHKGFIQDGEYMMQISAKID